VIAGPPRTSGVSVYWTYRRCDGIVTPLPLRVRRTPYSRIASSAVAHSPDHTMYMQIIVPVRPLPALQCTTPTFCGSNPSHASSERQKGAISASGGGLWSYVPCRSTRSAVSPRMAGL